MLLSYTVGQKKNPVRYPLKSIGIYVLIAGGFYAIMACTPEEWPVWTRLGINTVLILLFVGHILKHDLPVRSLPVIGKYFINFKSKIMENKPKKQRSYLNLFIRRLLSMKEDKAPGRRNHSLYQGWYRLSRSQSLDLDFRHLCGFPGPEHQLCRRHHRCHVDFSAHGSDCRHGTRRGYLRFRTAQTGVPQFCHRHYFQCAHGNVLFCHHTHKRSPVRTACPDLTYDLRRAHRALRRTGRHRSLV